MLASVPARKPQTATVSGTIGNGAKYQLLMASGNELISATIAATVIAALYRNRTTGPFFHPCRGAAPDG